MVFTVGTGSDDGAGDRGGGDDIKGGAGGGRTNGGRVKVIVFAS